MLKNKTKGNNIVNEVVIYQSIWLKAKGLMFTRKIKDKCLIFEFDHDRKVGLHMLFVFYPIDVLFLDKDRRVVEMKRNFRPFTAYDPKNEARYVIELPEGKAESIRTGNIISW